MDRVEWADGPINGQDPTTGMLGVGPRSRRSKTFIDSSEEATALSFIETTSQFYEDLMRSLHAHHHESLQAVGVNEKTDEPILKMLPEVLEKKESHKRYPALRVWDNVHQEVVEHFASVDGFMVDRVTHWQRQQAQAQQSHDPRGHEGTAGADRLNQDWK